MKIDSFYDDFDAWLDCHTAPLAAKFSTIINNSTMEDRHEGRHEYWLIAIGLAETSWFIYCQQYDAETFEDD